MVFLNALSTTKRYLTAAATVGLLFALPLQAAELVMVEQVNCEWCHRWNQEIGPIYPKTSEGRFAPLRRVDLRDMPDDLHVTRRVNFTPTFLIVENGQEIGRLEGYPGEDFFWPVIAQLLSKHAGYDADNTAHEGPDS